VATWVGLGLSLLSALAVNWAYAKEHDAAAGLPRLSPRRPLRSATLLLHERSWRLGFVTESGGWLIYVAALRLAPLALVQAVNVAGIAVLALLTARGHPFRLALHERLATLAALVGLVLLGLSLVGAHISDRAPNAVAALLWLAACGAGAATLTVVGFRISRAAAILGLAAGLLFAGGDISVKLVVHGGWSLLALLPLVAFYADDATSGCLPAGRCAYRRRARHPGDKRLTHGGRLRPLSRNSPSWHSCGAPGRRFCCHGRERDRPRRPERGQEPMGTAIPGKSRQHRVATRLRLRSSGFSVLKQGPSSGPGARRWR
jgi:hypothetical protein